MKVHFKKSPKNGEWYWHLKATNGKIIASGGEGFKTKWGVRRSARKALGI